MSFFYFFSIICFLVTCLLLCGIILLQEGKGGGLGASFGGGGDSSDSLFGTSTPEVLKKITGILSSVFMVLCLLLSFWTGSLTRHKSDSFVPQDLNQAETELVQES